jgi:hypothetical protein
VSSRHILPPYIARTAAPPKEATLYAKTVSQPVDKHVARLVDAINTSAFSAKTRYSCSGHPGKESFPYVSFECRGFAFVKFLLACVSRTNAITGGATQLRLTKITGNRVRGVIGFVSYPSRFGNGWPAPPAHLIRLWWAELDELARMVESGRAEASVGFRENVAKRRWLKNRAA